MRSSVRPSPLRLDLREPDLQLPELVPQCVGAGALRLPALLRLGRPPSLSLPPATPHEPRQAALAPHSRRSREDGSMGLPTEGGIAGQSAAALTAESAQKLRIRP